MNIRIILFLITTSLLVISKLASNYTNVSPFIALVIVSAYFIENKQHLLIMVFISQLISDIYFGFHSSNFFVYLSYFIMISIIYIHQIELSIVSSLIKSIHSNIIFFFVSNIGHFLTFNNTFIWMDVWDDGFKQRKEFFWNKSYRLSSGRSFTVGLNYF